MSEAQTVHSAAPSAAGYLYQARLALAEALRYAYRESDVEIAVEKLDDVSFEKDGKALELLQTKHHLKRSGDLTDSSVDLWRTLGIWAEVAKADPSLPSRIRFTLVTTAQAPTGSAAGLLRPVDAGGRDPAQAVEMLVAAGGASENKDLTQAIVAFMALTPEMREALVAAIEILDNAPLVGDIESLIEQRIRMMAPRGKATLAREQLEGWWWPRICAALQAEPLDTIPVFEVEQKLDDVRDSLKRDALPFDMADVDPSQEELDALEEMRFVDQLRLVGIGASRLHYAKRDFYRASTQRSHWARWRLLLDGEVAQFERTLVEEWQPRFARMCDDLAESDQEPALREAGHELYAWVEAEARFPLRTTISRFLNVGSYHILAEDLRVGWHRDFEVLCGDPDNGGSDGG